MSKNAFKKSIFLNPSKGNIMVNQRYLIDKILARYSTKFVIYRELMQNSDDANSSKVKIIFETKNPSTDKNILNDKIETIIYKNNGLAFKKEDWDRIQEIAVGNPGEQKIGAFGVGFYSLFSICEEPFVISNGKGMNFIWDHDQLLTVYGEIDGGDQEDRNWTTFAMRLREPDKFPDVEEFTLFLSDSLAFTSKIQEITVYFNNTQIIKLSKEEVQQATKSIDIKSEFNTYSPDKIFQLQLTSLNIKYIQMNVKRLLVLKNGSERQSLITDYQEEEISIVFKVADGILKITAKKEFSNEMKRITKKDLPEDTKIHMIFPEFKDLSKQVPSIFRKLLPYPEQGRMYVGFPTQQTIGCCLNLSAHVIPSVERESVDLVNNTLKDFNKEILNSAGILCSILYENEMNKIDEGFNVENMDQFEKRAAYVLRHFTFNKSTPNDFVGKIIEQQFFERLDQKLPILSTQGVLPITDVRIPNPKMEPFIKKVPIVPKMVLEDCKSFFKKANEMGLIKELSFQDVLLELSKRSLSEEIEIIALLEWWISVEDNTNLDKFTQFMQSATIRFINELKALDTIHYILDASFVTSETETLVPDDVLPYKISKNFKNSDMKKYFKWNKLPLVNWARFIVKQFDSEVTPTFAESVHKILAKNMNDTSQNDKNEIHDLFICKECIPTTRGMKKPDETYFQDVNLFPNLPVIQFQEFFDFQNLMKILGVNEVIKIDLILECASGENFDYMQLARYLGSMSDNLQDDEWEILKKAKIWSKEKPVTSRDDKIDDIRQKFAARELFVPLGSYREFCLPVIEWAEKWDHDTKEAKLLFELGLLKYPTLSKILELSAPPTEKGIRNNALEYFIKNFEDKYSDKYYAATIEIEFLPCSKSGVYAKPSECFINPDCEIMGFNVIDKDYRDKVEKLGVHHHPNSEKLFERLIENKLKTENEARVTFEYLETRDAFIESQWNSLSKSEFIPIYNKEHNIIQKNPHECFFKNSQGKTEEVFGEFFSFIDFGEAANRFLRKCGVKNEPPAIKIAELLVESSYKVWDSFKNDEKKYENYRFILQKIAEDFNTVKHKDPNLFIRMTKEPILLGVSEGNKKTLDSAKNIYINDNATYMKIFSDLLIVPEDYPKFLYECLECKRLSDSIEEEAKLLGNTRESKNFPDLQKNINEKAHLFYRDYPKHVIKRSEEWLKKLIVKETGKIEVKYSLKTKNRNKTNSVTAYILEDDGEVTLYINMTKLNYLEISNCLVKYIYKSHKPMDINHLTMILQTNSGYSKNDSKQVNLQHEIDKIRINQYQTQNYPNLEHLFNPLHAMFPDCKHDYIYQCLEQAEEDKLINVENHLMEGNYPKIKTPVNPYDPPVTAEIGKTFMNIIQIFRPNLGSYLKNQTIYCENIDVNGYSLQFEKLIDGMEFHIPENINKSEIFPKHQDSLDRFVNILKYLTEVFECAPKIICVFYDNSNLMAFNKDRVLFFNFKIYLDLYKNESTIDAITYWYMMICHELAHKFVDDHNSEHEYHLSSLATKYMKNLLKMMNKNKIDLDQNN